MFPKLIVFFTARSTGKDGKYNGTTENEFYVLMSLSGVEKLKHYKERVVHLREPIKFCNYLTIKKLIIILLSDEKYFAKKFS